ncbi:MAG: hypothetical protein HYU88_01735 [Chloroflexi bacterium]|nr:hypothetical protein [Chloroflexota bacterium]MBI4505434.1 hypothetical protein [Chloroflexota bacterium]
MALQYAPDLQARIKDLGLLDPTDRQQRQRRAALPLDTLHGKRAGFLDNRKGNADVLLERVRELLGQQYDLAATVLRPKWIYSAPAGPELVEELAQSCDFVVTAIGD